MLNIQECFSEVYMGNARLDKIGLSRQDLTGRGLPEERSRWVIE
jgi:hypothetical protein